MAPDIKDVLTDQIEQARTVKPNGTAPPYTVTKFAAVAEDHYRLSIPTMGITLDIDRLRREHNELIGELSVRCALPGARTFDGTLSIADFNLSSARARTDRAKLLALRANARELDWVGVMEEFAQRVLHAERTGQPAVDLRSMASAAAEEPLQIQGVHLLRRHPNIVFGDGGTLKSLLLLWILGCLAEKGIKVALFDWELCGEDHRDRLEKLFPDGMPQIFYCRCERALVYESDRLRRIVREHGIEFAGFDSVAFACDGPPESAEVAGRYYRAVRQVCPGSLHIAHVSKAEGADQKPFGSSFWHNGARATWYAQLAGGTADSDVLSLGLFNRKMNLGRLRPPIGFTVTFGENHTTVRRSDVAENPDLAAKLTIRQRMAALLKRGAMTPAAIAEEIEADADTVARTARRYKDLFVMIPDGRLALLQKRAS